MTERRDHDTLPKALQPFSRALAIHDALPDRFRPSDATPLRECLAGIWPTVADLRALVEWGVPNPTPQPSSVGATALLRRMSLALDDLSPDETIGFSNGVQWVEVATVEEIRKAEIVSDEPRSQVQFLPTEDGEINGNDQSGPSSGGWENEEKLTVEQAWTILCETPDITSPEEYPDHALITMEQLGSFMARAIPVGAIACPCTTFEQDEDCLIGYPSLLCTACDGKGIAPVDKVVALAAEMLKVAEQVDELEDPFAAWESIDLLKSQNAKHLDLIKRNWLGRYWRAVNSAHADEVRAALTAAEVSDA